LTLARLVRTFDMEICGTTPDDVAVHHVRLTGAPKHGTGEVKVKVTKKM
jgi:hypothetical protein